MSLRIRPPPSRSASDSDSSFRKPALPSRANGSGLKRAFAGAESDSDADSDSDRRELVDSFDQREAERRRVKKETPLVIAPLPNRDWRAVANARRVMRDQSSAPGTPDDSGNAARDRLNGGPVKAGLIKREPRDAPMPPPSTPPATSDDAQPKAEEDEDEDARARRLLLQSLAGDDADEQPTIGAISSAGNDWMLSRTPQNETEAYRIDVETRPDMASLEDYARVPIEQFGAAMLRGMGWSANSANNVQPYLPQQRPSLLGIGAKERAPEDIPTKPGVKVRKGKPDMKYMPLVKKERESGSTSSSRVPSRSASPTRATSRRSPSPSAKHSRKRDEGTDSDSRRDRDRDRDRRKDRDRDYDDRRDRDRERDYDDRRDRDRERRSDKDDYERDRRRRDDRDYDRSRDRDRDRSSRR